MTSIKKRHFVSISAVFLALLAACGCGGGSDDSTTGTGSDSPRAAQARGHDSPADHQRQGGAEAKPPVEDEPRHAAEKKVKGGEATPMADAHKQKQDSQRSEDVAERVRELVAGDSGDRVVDSDRELGKVLREIKREKQEQDVPPVLEEVLEKARGG